jgi:dipeptidase D
MISVTLRAWQVSKTCKVCYNKSKNHLLKWRSNKLLNTFTFSNKINNAMSTTLFNLKPESVWKHFQSLCNIPRPSKKEADVAKFVVNFAKQNDLYCKVDETGNVMIAKPATKGLTNLRKIVLQTHLDMVPQKNSDTLHDFEKDPIQPLVDGDWVKANGTTLGADNGIGVAAVLSVLESDNVQHGPLEALFTIDEETGMTGAFGLKPDFISGEILLNLDSEDEGELFIGCAGGINTTATFDYTKEPVTGDGKAYKLSLTGLKGGHSGVDIHLGRGNSNKLLNRFMWHAEHNFEMRLCSIDGGSLRNAIPRESFAIVTIPEKFESQFLETIGKFLKMYQEELAGVETNLKFTAESVDKPKFWIDKPTQDRLLDAVYALPNGVIRMIPEMGDVVETSTNLAIIKSNDNQIEINCLLRSSVESAKTDLANMMESIFDMAHAKTIHDGGYPGWKPDLSSSILKITKAVYINLFGKEPQIKVIHAGLECGLIGNVYPKIDMISFGPTIRYPHSPDEKVNIPSVERFWNYLVETLKNIPLA